ncbi:MAG: RES domain-containing protein [Vulcanimicrobiaceae bacterium]
MSRVYRVFPYDSSAAPTDPGGALFIPPQGSGRIDNPGSYAVRYVSDSAAGACAEAFNYGRYREAWSVEMLRGLPTMPGSRRALAWFELRSGARPLCNLDDPRELVAQGLRPSRIVTRDYNESRAWALRIFETKQWCGVRWWSYHDARWASIGLWDEIIADHGIETLSLNHPAIREAADVLSIRLKP